MPSTRINRVDDRLVVPVAVGAGVVAALGPAQPTGTNLADVVVVVVAVAAVTWAGAAARWWALAGLAGVATAIAPDLLWVVVGAASLGGALWIGTQRRDLAVERSVVTAVSLNVAIRSETQVFFGFTAVLVIVAAVVVALSGLRRRRPVARHNATIAVVVVGVLAALAFVGAAAAGAAAQRGLRDGAGLAREGISMLADGDYAAAAEQFEDAAGALSASESRLGGIWAAPSAWLPFVAQHRAAVIELTSSAATASEELAAALRVVDPEQLRLIGGRFDLDAIGLIEQPFVAVRDAIEQLELAVDRADSPWLVSPIGSRLEDLDAELAARAPDVTAAVDAVRLAPDLLGADGTRRYFVAFTTPAEARGLGGFMGNWAVLTASGGRIRLAEFGRTRDLNRGATAPRSVSGPADWLEQWGRYGFTNGPDGSTSPTPWSTVTVSPVFPSTALVMEELLPQSGVEPVDGVFVIDPEVLEGLLGLTGPISVDGSDVLLDESNVLQFLLVDQYEIDDNADRIDLLEGVSRATIERVLGGALPTPTVVAETLAPLAAQGRLLGWAVDPDEQALFESIGLTNSLPALDGGDGIAAVFNNAGPNKIDVYLERELTYTAVVDETTGAVTSELVLTLTNTADPDVLPDSVVQNATGDARGTNRTLLSLYSALELQEVTVEGRRISMRTETENGWIVNSAQLGIPPGGSITVVAAYAGTLELPDGYSLAVRPQPIVVPERQTIEVTSTDGSVLVGESGVHDRPTVFVASGTVPDG
jgi:hypothetical protein